MCCESFHDVCKSNHYAIHLKLIKHCLVNYISIKLEVKVGLLRKLSTEELMLLNCGVGEDS